MSGFGPAVRSLCPARGAELALGKAKQLEQLEHECKEQGIRLIYDDLRSEGGLCRLRGCYYVIMNRRLAAETRTRIIVDALARVGDCTRMGTVPKPESAAVASDFTSSAPQEVMAETASAPEPVEAPVPLAIPRPEFEYEEPEVGVPIGVGVPNSQS
jgi:hypothetical protein